MVVSNNFAEAAEASRSACFGRFLVTIPAGGEVAAHTTGYLFGDIVSKRFDTGEKGFSVHMAGREAQLRETGGLGGFQFVSTIDGSSRNRRIFKLYRELITRSAFGFEAYKYDEKVVFSVSQYGYESHKIDSVLDRVQTRIIQGLRIRDSQEIPLEPGLCIKDGFIASDGSESAFEETKLFFDFAKWPELSLTVASRTAVKPEPSLLTRLNNAAVPEVFLSLMGQMKTLRRGKHDVGPFKGEESLDMVPADGGYKVHMFRWETQGVPDDPFRPNLVVELTTGRNSGYQDKRPTISEQEAVELFDAVVNSIRLRPTGPAKRSEAVPIPKAALGEMATTGRQCPQTGRWRAEEGEERLIREGEVMPHTPVSGTASLWQKLRGEAAPTYRSATVWKLVAYEMPADDTPPDGRESAG